jgi:uncharacterized protein YdaU (DUF1376 family)
MKDTPERNKTRRLEWFAFAPAEFLNDERIIHLTPKQRGQWLYLLIQMWDMQGYVPDSVAAFSNMLSISLKEAIAIKDTLQSVYLLRHDGPKLYSPRLRKEYEISLLLCERGKKAAEARWHPSNIIQFPVARE